MAGTLVGFQPCGAPSNASVPPNPFHRSSSGRSQPARSLLSELLFAAVTAEQQAAEGREMAEEAGHLPAGVVSQAVHGGQGECWMEDASDDCSEDDDEGDSEEEGESEEEEGDMGMLLDVLPQARSSPLPIPPPA